ncbi:large with signal peptide and acidic plus glycine repeats [Cryptosporidium sp. chipmunk genotype I]|uniref:large with signal peptide and acidic plus glycine repeats n=1 Tax=Cryptosporidium sp. chipmunk genotype I TaxID=1280935 RepID=UPI00351A967F|nr:large with signal peptide and acidic plus glycine repeats [Cryptosporidium sp. chipmunk genotype I]
MFMKKLILFFFILIFLIFQSQESKNDLSSLTSNLVSKYMTKEEFLDECRNKLPKFRSNLTEIQVYFLCLKALKSSLDTIYNSSVGKLLNSDSVPKNVVQHKTENENIEGYRKLLDDVSNIFSSDVYFDEDLLEADNGLFSSLIQAIMEVDKQELRRKELMEKKVREIQNTEERLKEEYRRKLKKKYPEAYHPLALEILSTISEEDIETWMHLPLKLKLPVINYYFLLVSTKSPSSEKRDRHKIFTEAIVSTVISKNEIKIPKYMTLQDIRYEICKLGVLYKSGCKIVPLSTLLSLPRHSFDIWKSFGLTLQFEFLIAMTYSIDRETNFDDCDEEIFKITKEKKLRKDEETKIRVYLSHFFPEEDSLPMKHFKSALRYLLDVAVNDEPSKLGDQSQLHSMVSSDFNQVKSDDNSSIQENKSESLKELIKETKIENEFKDRIENQEREDFSGFLNEVTDTLTTKGDKIDTSKDEHSLIEEFLTPKNDTDNILEVAKLEELKKMKDGYMPEDAVSNKNEEEFNLISLLNSQAKRRDAEIVIKTAKSNGLKKVDVEGLNSLPPSDYNPYSNIGIGPALMNGGGEDKSFHGEEENAELRDESNNDPEEHEGAENIDENLGNGDSDENVYVEGSGNDVKEDDSNTRRDESGGDYGNVEGLGMGREDEDKNDDKDYSNSNDQDGNNEEDILDGGNIKDNNEDLDSGEDAEGEGINDGERADSYPDSGDSAEGGGEKDKGEDFDPDSGDGAENGGEKDGEEEEDSDSGDGVEGEKDGGEEGDSGLGDIAEGKDEDEVELDSGNGAEGGDKDGGEEEDSDSGDGVEGEKDGEEEEDSDSGDGVEGEKDGEEEEDSDSGDGVEGEKDGEEEGDSDSGDIVEGKDKDGEEESSGAGGDDIGNGDKGPDYDLRDAAEGGGELDSGGFAESGGDKDEGEEGDSDSGDGVEGEKDGGEEGDSDSGDSVGEKDGREEGVSDSGDIAEGKEEDEREEREQDFGAGEDDIGDSKRSIDSGGSGGFGMQGGGDSGGSDKDPDFDLGGDDGGFGIAGGNNNERGSGSGEGFGMVGGDDIDDSEGNLDSKGSGGFGMRGEGYVGNNDRDPDSDSVRGGQSFGIRDGDDSGDSERYPNSDSVGVRVNGDFGRENKNHDALRDSTEDTGLGDLEKSEFGQGPSFGGGSKSEHGDSYSFIVGNNNIERGFGKDGSNFEMETGDNLNSGGSNSFGNSSFKSLGDLDNDDSEINLEKGTNSLLEGRIGSDVDDLDSNLKGIDTPIDGFGNSGIGSREDLGGNDILTDNHGFNDYTDIKIAEGASLGDGFGLGINEGDKTGVPAIGDELDFGSGKVTGDLDRNLEELNDSLGGFNIGSTGVDELFEGGNNKANNLGLDENEILGDENFENEGKFDQNDTSNRIDSLLNEFEKGNDLSDGNNYNELKSIQGAEAENTGIIDTENFLNSLIKPTETGLDDIEANSFMNGDNGGLNFGLELGNDAEDLSFDISKSPSLFEIDSNVNGEMNKTGMDLDLDKAIGNLNISDDYIVSNPNDNFDVQNKNLEKELEELAKLGDPDTETREIDVNFSDNSVVPAKGDLNDQVEVLEELSDDGSNEEDEFELLERLLNEKKVNRDFGFASTVDSEEFTDEEEESNELNLPDERFSVGDEHKLQSLLPTHSQVLSETDKSSVLPDDQLSLLINSIPGIKDNSKIEINEALIRDLNALNSIYEDINDIIYDLNQNGSSTLETPEIDQIDTVEANSNQAVDNNINNIYFELIGNDKEPTNISITDGSLDDLFSRNAGEIKEDDTDYIGDLDILTRENKISDQGFEDDLGLEELFKDEIDNNFQQSELIPFLDELERGNALFEDKKASSDTRNDKLADYDLLSLYTEIENENNKKLFMEGDPKESISMLFGNGDQYNSAASNEENLDIFDIRPDASIKIGEVENVLSDMINDGGISADSSIDQLGFDLDMIAEINQKKDFEDDYIDISILFEEPKNNLEKKNIEDENISNGVHSSLEDDYLYLNELFRTEEKKDQGFEVDNDILLDQNISDKITGVSDEEINLGEIDWFNERSLESDKKVDETTSIIEDLHKLFEMNGVGMIGFSEGDIRPQDELIFKEADVSKDLNSSGDVDDLRLDEFFDTEVNLDQYNTNSKTFYDTDIPEITSLNKGNDHRKRKRMNKKNKRNKKGNGGANTEEYEISSEELDFLFNQSERYLDQSLNKQKTDSLPEDGEFVDFDRFMNMGNVQVKKSNIVKANKLDPDDIDSKRNFELTSSIGGIKEEENTQLDSRKKMLRGASFEENKDFKPKNRSLGTIIEKQKGGSEKEWIMSFAPKLRPGRMQRRRDLFSDEEIEEAIKEARLA